MSFIYFGKSVYQKIDNIYALEFHVAGRKTKAHWYDGIQRLYLKMSRDRYDKIIKELLKFSNKFALIDDKIFQISLISTIDPGGVRFTNGKMYVFKEKIKDKKLLENLLVIFNHLLKMLH